MGKTSAYSELYGIQLEFIVFRFQVRGLGHRTYKSSDSFHGAAKKIRGCPQFQRDLSEGCGVVSLKGSNKERANEP